MENLYIYEKVRSVPAEAKKTIQAGKLKGFTDVNPMWRLKMLTDIFGPCGFGWYTEINERWIEKGPDGKEAAFVKINLFVKQGEEWSKPIVGIGGSMFVNIFKGNAETSDEAFKMAYTDAISIACKALGMAADVYFEKDRTKYNANDGQLDKEQKAEKEPITAKEKEEKLPEYATEAQIDRLMYFYENHPDKLTIFLNKNGVTSLTKLPYMKAQAQLDRMEAAKKINEAKARKASEAGPEGE